MFTLFVTESGRQLKVTADHLLLGGSCGLLSYVLLPADQLRINDCLYTITGEEVIQTISPIQDRGIYTVVTQSEGLLVVNGVIASSFANNHMVANSFYNIYRTLYRLVPSWSQISFMMTSIEEFGDIVLKVLKLSLF